MTPPLIGEDAITVSRITGIPWAYERVVSRGPLIPTIHLARLPYVMQMRVAVAMIGAHVVLDAPEHLRCPSFTEEKCLLAA